MNSTAGEVSPRFRRKSSFRLWTKDEEEELLELADMLQAEDTHGSHANQITRLWESNGHTGVTGDELMKKLQSIKRIRAMLDRKDGTGFGTTRGGSFSGSILEDTKWEEETLQMVKDQDVEGFTRRMSFGRRASAASDSHDRSALHHAASTGNLTLIQMIAKEVGDLDPRDKDERTPLFFALGSAQDDAVGWLLERGAKVDIADSKGTTPLHIACHTNNRYAVRLILELGAADVNARDERGTTALHVAAHRASSDIIELLLSKGADATLKDQRGNLAMHLAKRMEKAANVRRLSMGGAATVVQAAVRMAGMAGLKAKSDAGGEEGTA